MAKNMKIIKGFVNFPELTGKPKKLVITNISPEDATWLKDNKVKVKVDDPDKYNSGYYFNAQTYFDDTQFYDERNKLIDLTQAVSSFSKGAEVMIAVEPYIVKNGVHKGKWMAGFKALRLIKKAMPKGGNPFAGINEPTDDIFADDII